MFTQKISNRTLLQNCKYSNLSTNFSSAISAITVINSNGFSSLDYILLGEFGSETAEICQIGTVVSATNTLNLASPTKYAHPADTKVSLIRYSMAKFWWNSTKSTVGAVLLATIDLQADSLNTQYGDTAHSSGFGYTEFWNPTSFGFSTPSNFIPYAGPTSSTVSDILDDFYSQLNDNERKSISTKDALRWCSNGYLQIMNAMNLVNKDYYVTAEYPLVFAAGTATVSMPTDLFRMVSITDADGNEIDPIDISLVRENNANGSQSSPMYYIRDGIIGISPIPTSDVTFYLYYKKTAPRITSISDEIDVPSNNPFILTEFLLLKAAGKITRLNAQLQQKVWTDALNSLKVTAYKQNGEQESFEIDPYANI
ncbi:MAG: hypothetical protein WC479_12005 [Candidatus Izemoplasmatales bacterium]|jgi:hypothetical protein